MLWFVDTGTKVICSVTVFIEAFILIIIFILILFDQTVPLNLNGFHFSKRFALLLVVNYSQFSQGKRSSKIVNCLNFIRKICKTTDSVPIIGPSRCHYFVLIVFNIDKIHEAKPGQQFYNCNILTDLARVWPSWMEWNVNEIFIMFTNFITQSINQICLYHAAHSLR